MRFAILSTVLGMLISMTGFCADQQLPGQAAEAMAKAVTYLRAEVAVGGGYLGSYKADLSDQWGEGHATRDQNWIQPPGNPSVGFAFLRAWEATGDQHYLDGVVEVAKSLVYGQLECGGWDYIVDHSPKGAQRWYYRHNTGSDDESLEKGRNQGTFDDNVTQHATRLLIAADQALRRVYSQQQAQKVIESLERLEFRLIPEHYTSVAGARDGYVQWRDKRIEPVRRDRDMIPVDAPGPDVVKWEQVLADSEVKFRGSDLKPNARILPSAGDDPHDWAISFELTDDKKEAFREFSGQHVGRLVAFVLDGKCLMAPVIKTAIPGAGVIQGSTRGEKLAFLNEGHAAIHDAAIYALEYVLEAQYPAGGWPQRYPLRGKGYGDFHTFNDNSIADCTDVMMIAWRAYGDRRYYDAVVKVGEFIIAVQQPEPQPAWAQQYDMDLKPAWARKFEPPSITGGESRGVIRILIKIALFTEDDKYLKPIGPALEWYKRSELYKLTGREQDKGKWARFYELGTNKPLYFTANTYVLTYDDSNVPGHYSFQGNYYPLREEKQYKEIVEKGIEQYLSDHEAKPLRKQEKLARAETMEGKLRGIIEAQDAKGRWTKGDMIYMPTFETNIRALAAYLKLVNDR